MTFLRTHKTLFAVATLAIAFAGSGGTAAAQQRPDPAANIAAQQQALAPLSYMDGVWRGQARTIGMDPSLLHRVAVIGAGTLDSLPHNGAVVTLLAVCGATHKESYFHIAMVAIAGAIASLVVVILLGNQFGSF